METTYIFIIFPVFLFLLILLIYFIYLYFTKQTISIFHRSIKGSYYSVGSSYSDNPFIWDMSSVIVYGKENIAPEQAKLVADPFIINFKNNWYMFYEQKSIGSKTGADIALAISNDGREWKYDGIVLDEDFHLSYPYVFRHKGSIFMLPESQEAKDVRLYMAKEFPKKWELRRIILTDIILGDPSIVKHGDKWYLFASTKKKHLRLFFSDNLLSEFIEHPKSPIKKGNFTRMGGRIIRFNENLVRFAQDHFGGYGRSLYAFIIEELSPHNYKEHPFSKNPVLKNNGDGWAKNGMHHIDVHQISNERWLGVFDGNGYGEEKIVFNFNKRLKKLFRVNNTG